MKVFHSLLKHKSSKIASLAVIAAGCILPASLAAQQRDLQVIPSESTANLFLGSRDNPTSYSAGTARVSGTVEINPDDIGNSVFNLTAYAANRSADDPAAVKNMDGGDQPAISFQSQHVTLLKDGSLEVAGQLTVTSVSREAVANPDDSYSGPKFGPPVVSNTSQAATLIFAPPVVQSTPANSTPDRSDGPTLLEVSQPERKPVMELKAQATVKGEDFPELATSVAGTVWPLLINNEKCTAPSSIGDDYSGAICTGTIENSISPALEPMQAPGDDYAGVRQVPPSGNQVTIQFHLALADAAPASAAGNWGGDDNEGATSPQLRESVR